MSLVTLPEPTAAGAERAALCKEHIVSIQLIYNGYEWNSLWHTATFHEVI